MTDNVFTRKPEAFQMLGKEYKFEFIPSIYCQEVIEQVLETIKNLLSTGAIEPMVKDGESGEKVKGIAYNIESVDITFVISQFKTLLKDKIYRILQTVLDYQNKEKVDIETLKFNTSAYEIAVFLDLLISDPEIIKAVGVVVNGLGKLTDLITPLAHSVTKNSMQSSSASSEEIPNT